MLNYRLKKTFEKGMYFCIFELLLAYSTAMSQCLNKLNTNYNKPDLKKKHYLKIYERYSRLSNNFAWQHDVDCL